MKDVTVKCRGCGKLISKNGSYNPKPRIYYCSIDCVAETKEKVTVITEKSSRVMFTDFIQSIYLEQGYHKDKIPWTLITSQIKNIMNEHKEYSYESMAYVLGYMKDIESVNLFSEESNGSILSLLPFYHDKAKDYFELSQEIIEKSDCVSDERNISTIKKSRKVEREVRW